MELSFLTGTPLFHGLTEEETAAALKELGAYTRRYEKDEQILHPGEPAAYMGLVLSGSVHIESCDVWGGRSLLGRAGRRGTCARYEAHRFPETAYIRDAPGDRGRRRHQGISHMVVIR